MSVAEGALMTGFVLVCVAAAVRRSKVPVLVATAWEIDLATARADQPYALVRGRKSGIVSWLLGQFKLEDSTELRVTADGIEQRRASLFAKSSRWVPFKAVSEISTSFAYPVADALVVFFSAALVTGAAGWLLTPRSSGFSSSVSRSVLSSQPSAGNTVTVLVAGVVIGFMVAIVHLILHKRVVVEVSEHGQSTVGFAMKRSVIEGKEVDLARANELRDLMRLLTAEAVDRTVVTGTGHSLPRPPVVGADAVLRDTAPPRPHLPYGAASSPVVPGPAPQPPPVPAPQQPARPLVSPAPSPSTLAGPGAPHATQHSPFHPPEPTAPRR